MDGAIDSEVSSNYTILVKKLSSLKTVLNRKLHQLSQTLLSSDKLSEVEKSLRKLFFMHSKAFSNIYL